MFYEVLVVRRITIPMEKLSSNQIFEAISFEIEKTPILANHSLLVMVIEVKEIQCLMNDFRVSCTCLVQKYCSGDVVDAMVKNSDEMSINVSMGVMQASVSRLNMLKNINYDQMTGYYSNTEDKVFENGSYVRFRVSRVYGKNGTGFQVVGSMDKPGMGPMM